MSQTKSHVLEQRSADLFRRAWLTDEARALIHPKQNAGDLLLDLASHDLHDDACQCLAYAMPNRSAVWWLCQCLWHERARLAGPSNHAALEAAVEWVLHPTPENVHKAELASDAAPFESPARCAANAAFLAGHGPAIDAPVTSERQNLVAQLIGGALTLATVSSSAGTGLTPEQALNLGLDVVRGISRWETILAAHEQTVTTKPTTGGQP
ncbi:MAG: hypothetical protein U1D30_20475 [Planctomycetota bacterium]